MNDTMDSWTFISFEYAYCYMNAINFFGKIPRNSKKFISLTPFFPMFPFDPPENIRKPKVFLCFQGGLKGNIGKKRVKIFCQEYSRLLFFRFFRSVSKIDYPNLSEAFQKDKVKYLKIRVENFIFW